MTFKEQLMKIKDNWLLVAVFIVAFLMLFFLASGGPVFNSMGSKAYSTAEYAYDSGYDMDYRGSGGSIAPTVIDRIIIKSASLSVEVDDYMHAEDTLRQHATSYDALITSQSVNSRDGYSSGSYTVQIPINSYDEMVLRLKGLGEVKSFNENANDVTGSYVRLSDVISTERSKLAQYESMYESSNVMKDKIELIDRIAAQKSLIDSLEYQQNSTEEKTDYIRVQLSLSEKRPAYSHVTFATLADLWAALLESLNVLLYFIAYVLPFAVLGVLIWLIAKIVNRKK